ncbi:hypothetical protein [Aequorivita sp. CIP111184]|uniref:hypothetical protein n=1 Tax=Aequorivita sp. CIP111184 TaxID=2211356 RepID=UPI000DBBCD90|nr:hypothetical protein [Aequorivita sp. CIP111184]SRX52245.1 hypothetical protein AEQU1_00108 [Aequorivita sp. CIP111184]
MQFAILVATIIAILLGSFLTLSQTHLFFNTQSRILGNVIDNANAGIHYSLKKEHLIADSISIENDIYTTRIKKASWGGYLKINSTALAKTKSFSKIALTGSKVSDPALGIYLSESKLPLVLVGNTVIEGDAYVSDFGIKPGIISGHYYNGKELVRGNISSGKGSLPELDPVWVNDIRRLQEYVPFNLDEVIEREAINKNSFFENTHFVYDENKITLNETYIGNIIIKSVTEVVVTNIAQLTDVVVIAPKITIEEGFAGSASFIAEERISLAENVQLDYPSSLILVNTKNDENIPVQKGEEPIFIADNSIIEGTVIYLDERKEKTDNSMNSFTHVAIAPMGTVNGYVYCQGNVELMGTVIGAIYANRFLAREFGSVYINHIYNGKVWGRDIDPAFGGLPFKDSDKAIVKWLY